MRTMVRAVLLFSITLLLAVILHAQNAPDPISYEARVTAYCQSMASGHEQDEALKNACQYALTVQRSLPNYICDENIRRFSRNRLLDVIDAQVTVIDGKDSYSNIRINGEPTEKTTSQLAGIWSSGEFGMLVPLLFAPENRASFVFKREEKLNSRPTLLFSFEVNESENRSFFIWDENGKTYKPGYKGSLWVDKETSRPIRIKAKSSKVRIRQMWGSDRLEYVAVETEYDDVPLADSTSFLLPGRSKLQSCTENPGSQIGSQMTITRNSNELKYTNCHKFRAKAKIVE